jgi:ribosomal-protein-alanine N-acetyltransferase
MHIVAQTPRLIIREFIPADEEMYLNHFNDSLVALYLPRRSREERSIIFRNAVNYAADKRLGTWGMYDKTRGDFIGSCLLRLFSDIEPRQIELGYSLERRYWGLGIGTEMAKAMVSHGFTGDIDEIV